MTTEDEINKIIRETAAERLDWKELGIGEVANVGEYELCVFPSEGLTGYQVVGNRGLEAHGEVETVKEAKQACLGFVRSMMP